jgi:hypothetical protein
MVLRFLCLLLDAFKHPLLLYLKVLYFPLNSTEADYCQTGHPKEDAGKFGQKRRQFFLSNFPANLQKLRK